MLLAGECWNGPGPSLAIAAGDRTDENPANQPPLGLNQRHSGAPSAPSPFGLAISAIVG
jgi:hypothetical protein